MYEDAELSPAEALTATIELLTKYWERGRSDEIGALLGSLAIQPDGRCADPALWNDWLSCVDAVVEARSR